MKTVEIIGFKRANLGKKESKRLREEGNVPCVVYGASEQIHFYAPMILFRELVYTNDAHFVHLNIEGVEKRCILQDIQFHPVNEIILHADFLEMDGNKPIKMDIPVHVEGNAPGVIKGGKLLIKNRKLTVKAKPDQMPESLTLDVSKLNLGDTIKVGEIETDNFEILTNPRVSVVVVNIPRALRGGSADDEEEGEDEEAEGAEAESAES